MRWSLFLVGLLANSSSAQDFASRANEGDRVMLTEAGDAYMDAIAPTLRESVLACLQEGTRMTVGEAITLVARVSREGTLSSVEVEPPIAASACLSRRLQTARLPSPGRWDWQRGEFPLTIRVGLGRSAADDSRDADDATRGG
jgi:hypothetical protein